MSERYSKKFRVRVAQEAADPSNEGLEHIVAAKYHLRPNTVLRWKTAYLEQGEDGLKKGRVAGPKKTKREVELEREVLALKQEVAILKKAAAFLADMRRE